MKIKSFFSRYFSGYIILLVIIFTGGLTVHGQVLETVPPSVDWYQINTEHFRFIFPEGYGEKAREVANTMEHLYQPVSSTLQSPPRKIDVILQNKTAVSNGFVSYGPRRSEFFTMPPQNYNLLGTNQWLELLSIHEFRHVVQFEKMNTGFNRFVYYTTGEDGFATMAGAGVPRWYWEGDAVVLETALTRSGRGRIPNFSLEYKTNLHEFGPFNYHKQHLRSFKHFIPDHYRLGYYMNAYLREKYGAEVLSVVIERASRRSYFPFAFSNSLKKHTGQNLVQTYNSMMDDLKAQSEGQLESIDATSFTPEIRRRNKAYTNYMYPQLLENGDIIALKSGLGDISQFVRIRGDGRERRVFTPGFLNDAGMLSVEDNIIAWAEFENDPRWLKVERSVIKTYNVETGERKVLTPGSRLAGPVLAPGADRIATVQTTEEGKHSIVILAASDGRIIHEFSNPENYFFSNLRWSPDRQRLIGVKHTREGKTLTIIDPVENTARDLYTPRHENVSHPVIYEKYVLYNSPYSGIDNIYAFDREQERRYQVTSSRYGSYNPEVSEDGGQLYYNEYTALGMDIVSKPLDPTAWTPIEQVKQKETTYLSALISQENDPDLLETIPNNEYPVKRYSRAAHLFNIYNWGPFLRSNSQSLFAGISSQDVLSTMQSSVGYVFDDLEGSGYGVASLSYQGWYPIIDAEVTYGSRINRESFRDTTDNQIKTARFDWDELGISGGVRIPLVFNHSKLIHDVTVSNIVSFTRVYDLENDFNGNGRNLIFPSYDQVGEGDLLSNRFRLSYFLQQKRSRRDINSKWGGYIIYENISTPFGGDFQGGSSVFRGGLYLPGLLKHHSIHLRGGYQGRKITLDRDNYWFRNRLPFPRGFGSSIFSNVVAYQGNYHLPVWYPDIALGPVVNFQRLRLNLFGDYGYGLTDITNNNEGIIFKNEREYKSIGAELRVDMNAMRFPVLFSLGVRASYLPDIPEESPVLELLIGNIGF